MSSDGIPLTLPSHWQGPAIPMIRRHTKGDVEIHFEPAIRVVSGNYIAAKRRGVVDGVDYGLTGEVSRERPSPSPSCAYGSMASFDCAIDSQHHPWLGLPS